MKTEKLDPIAQFGRLPDDAFVRLPVVLALFGWSKPTAWRACKDGRLPPPTKLSARVTGWRVGDLRRKLNELRGDGHAPA